jgi:hypothetical protein
VPAIAVDHAVQAVTAGAVNGVVDAAGTTSTGRPTPMQFQLATATLIIERATQLEWVVGDADGYHLHLLTPGGRWYRMRAVHPYTEPATGDVAVPADTN